jgi:hypothetical protein
MAVRLGKLKIMYTGLLHAHNGFRWLILIALFIAILLAFTGWIKKHEWTKTSNATGLILMIVMDIQFLLGLILYLFVSPITKAAFNDFGAAMKNPDLRFYAVEHILMMVIALVLVHIGRTRTKKEMAGWKRHRAAAVFYTLSFLIILAAIPWDRALF